MRTDPNKRPRGRPRTLDRGRLLDTAVGSYWAEGVDSVSLNEICRRADVSKPGLYREFGSEDGLMKAALVQYFEQVLVPVLHQLAADVSFRDTLDTLTTLITADRADQGFPTGCLIVKMNNDRAYLGAATRKQLDRYKKQILSAYEDWVERAKEKGEITAQISTPLAAVYIDAQLSNAMSQQARGEDAKLIRGVLKIALSVFG